MPGPVASFGLRGLTREVSRRPPPTPFETDVPVFFGAVEPVTPPASDADPFTALTSAAEFDATFKPAKDRTSHLPDAIAGFFRNGGRRAFVADPAAPLASLLEALHDRLDIDLVCAPDLADQPAQLGLLLAHLARGAPQFAILDVAWDGLDRLGDPAAAALDACALYGPWVRFDARDRAAWIPPSGLVAGSFARVGPGVAPANLALDGALDVRALSALRPSDAPRLSRNALTVQSGRGVRVGSARTLSGRDIAARRLVQTIERWCRLHLDAVAFEPNTLALCARVRRGVEAFLLHLHRAGLLSGTTPDEAFLVVCDERNNPREGLTNGRLVVDLRVTPSRTIEEVRVHLVRVDGRVTVAVDTP